MIQTKTRFIVNPHSGRLAERWPYIEEEIKSRFEHYDIIFTRYRHHARELTYNAIEEGFEWIAPVGGDGTVNEVVNGLIFKDKPRAEGVALIPVPSGRGNDFSKAAFRTSSPHELFVSLDKGEHKIRHCDIGRITYRDEFNQETTSYFVNLAGVGISTRMLACSNTLKKFTSWNLYSISLLLATLFIEKIPLKIELDDHLIDGTDRVVGFLVNNGPYGGGGMHLASGAKINDGILNCTLIKPFSFFTALAKYRLLYQGAIDQLPFIKRYRFQRSCRIHIGDSNHARLPVDFDGEISGTLPATIEVVPNALPLLVTR